MLKKRLQKDLLIFIGTTLWEWCPVSPYKLFITTWSNKLDFVTSLFLWAAYRVEHILPQAHFRFPCEPPSQLVSDPLHRHHHGTNCEVKPPLSLHILRRLRQQLTSLLCLILSASGSTMRTSQTRSARELEPSAGCLGKFDKLHIPVT